MATPTADTDEDRAFRVHKTSFAAWGIDGARTGLSAQIETGLLKRFDEEWKMRGIKNRTEALRLAVVAWIAALPPEV